VWDITNTHARTHTHTHTHAHKRTHTNAHTDTTWETKQRTSDTTSTTKDKGGRTCANDNTNLVDASILRMSFKSTNLRNHLFMIILVTVFVFVTNMLERSPKLDKHSPRPGQKLKISQDPSMFFLRASPDTRPSTTLTTSSSQE
jgi:hypothetical protein